MASSPSRTSKVPLPTNVAISYTGSPARNVPPIAPFWDDLKLGASGEVLYLVEGSFPRRLIVQWNKVEKSRPDESVPSELTFQVQLWETGELRFAYKTLVGEGASGASASIGWRHDLNLLQDFSFNQPILVRAGRARLPGQRSDDGRLQSRGLHASP